MKTLKTGWIGTLTRLAIVIGLITGPYASPVVKADGLDLDKEATVVSGALGAVNLDTPIILRYVGQTPAGGTVTVSAGASITLKTGAVGASTADATTECPVSGALGGVIDTTNAACNTLGEVCDAINLPNSNWRCIIMDGLRSDDPAGLGSLSEATATDPAGLGLKAVTTTALTATTALTPERGIDSFLVGTAFRFNPDPYRGMRYKFLVGNWTSTYGSGTSTITVYSVKQTYNGTTGKSTEVVTTLYSTPGGATTVNKELSFATGNAGLYAKKGEKLLVRLTNSAAMTAVTSYSYGYGVHYN